MMKNKFLVCIKHDGKIFSDVNLNGKFYNDEIFHDGEKYFVLVNGVVLNSRQLAKDLSFRDYVLRNLHKGGGGLYKEWRGNFCGVFYDRENKRGTFFTDHFASEPIFYYQDGKNLIISSSVKILIDFLKRSQIKINISMAGAYSMLVYGFMYDNCTPFEGIYKLLPGTCINIYPDGKISGIEYYYRLFDGEQNNTNLDDVTHQMSELFMKAIELSAAKNREYGFNNYSALSAGLDSRMTCFALKKLGVDNAVLFTYSQTGQKDNVIPGKIAADLKYPWLFKSLDNGLDMFDIEESIMLSDSLIYYLWPSQLNGFLKLIDREKMGVIHTGVIGDVVAGSYYGKFTRKPYTTGTGGIWGEAPERLKAKLKNYVREREYRDYEEGIMYNRAINGVIMGYSTSFTTCGEAVSPFMYPEFFSLCMSVPFKYRTAHYLYYKWVREFMADAAKYRYNGMKIHDCKKYIELKNRYISLDRICDILLRMVQIYIGVDTGMNPAYKWYSENESLKNFMYSYFADALEFVGSRELKEDMINLYESKIIGAKAGCITLAGSIKNFLC